MSHRGQFSWKSCQLSSTALENIRRFYGKRTGNQPPVHFPLVLKAPINIFRNRAQYGSKEHVLFLVIYPFHRTKVLVNMTPVNWQPEARYITVKSSEFLRYGYKESAATRSKTVSSFL